METNKQIAVATNISTKIYIDYGTARYLYDSLGQEFFIKIIDNSNVIASDTDTYDFLNSIIKNIDF